MNSKLSLTIINANGNNQSFDLNCNALRGTFHPLRSLEMSVCLNIRQEKSTTALQLCVSDKRFTHSLTRFSIATSSSTLSLWPCRKKGNVLVSTQRNCSSQYFFFLSFQLFDLPCIVISAFVLQQPNEMREKPCENIAFGALYTPQNSLVS